MRTPPHSRLRRYAFTLIDIMIVVLIIGILAAIVIPLVSHHVSEAEDAAAVSTHAAVQKAVEVYMSHHGIWPAEITDDLFQGNEPPVMPDGYSLNYDSATGEVALVID